jgi:signal transduction histidine kinase
MVTHNLKLSFEVSVVKQPTALAVERSALKRHVRRVDEDGVSIVTGRPESEIPRRRVVLLAASAVAFAFALVLLPGPHRDMTEIGIAAVLAIAVVGLATLWRSLPAVARIGVPLAFIAVNAVLVDGSGGTSSGFGGLFLLPLLWFAVFGSRAELLLGLVAVFSARALPVKLIGAPEYPASEWRFAIVLGAVAAIACITIQQLVRDARLRATELLRRAAELEEAAQQLADQNKQLRELDHLKDDFVAVVSHELRTPLTSIAGYLEMVLEENAEPLAPDQRQFLTTVSRNVERLTTVVNELLFLVQVDAGRLELSLAEADINELLAEATEAAQPAANAKQIELTLEAGRLAPAVCDRARIAQLIDNLVSNAVKFTPEGGRVEVRAAQDGTAIALSVSDSGIGIPAEELPRLFGRFFRASSAITNAIPGTGLGLAISQAIAEAHNSTITVQSTPAKGTTFRVLLASGA